MQEGEHGDHVAVIVSGLTEIRVREEDTERVVALQTVVALVIRTADFAAFVSTYPAVLKIVEEQVFTRRRRTGGGSYCTGGNCTVVRTDVVGFGAEERDLEAYKIIRRESAVMTRRALGTVWDTCRREDRGDGLLIVAPPTSRRRRSSSGWLPSCRPA